MSKHKMTEGAGTEAPTTTTTPPVSTAEAAPNAAAELRGVVSAYLETYRPQSLSGTEWDQLGPAVRRIAGATQPVSVADARGTAGALARMLVWSLREVGPADPAVVLTGPHVWRYLVGAYPEGQTRRRQRDWLMRAVRVVAGEPSRTMRHPARPGKLPYDDAELATLRAQAADSSQLAAVLVSTLEWGQVRAARREAAVDGRQASAGGYSDGDWTAAKIAAVEAGVALVADRLRATWAVGCVTTADVTLPTLLRGERALPLVTLGRTLRHLIPQTDTAGETARTLLREA